MKSALLLSLGSALLQCASAQFVNCTTDVLIQSQDDADKLGKCSKFEGRVVFGPEIEGDIRIVGLKKVSRGFSNFDCPPSKPSCLYYESKIRSIYSDVESLTRVEFIGGLNDLVNLSLPNLADAFEFNLVSLPMLETVAADKLLAERGAIFVELADLPKLETLTQDHKVRYSGRLNLTGTGLTEVNAVPLSQNLTSTPGLRVKDSKPIRELVSLYAAGGPGIYDHGKTVSVIGSGDASLEMSLVGTSIDLRDFNLEGVKDMSLDMSADPAANVSAETVTVTGNQLETLYIPLNNGYFPDINISENPELKTVHWGSVAQLEGLSQTIVIANNSKLHLTSTYSHKDNDTTWVWPEDNMKDMTFIGDFDKAFFDTYIDYETPDGEKRRYSKPSVLGTLKVESTADDLQCAKLASVIISSKSSRDAHLQCNGRKYVNDSAGSRTAPAPPLVGMAVMALVAMAWI